MPFSKEIHDFLTLPVVELGITFLVLVSCLLLALETLTVERSYLIAEDAIGAIFVIEVRRRVTSHFWCCRQMLAALFRRIRYRAELPPGH